MTERGRGRWADWLAAGVLIAALGGVLFVVWTFFRITTFWG